MHEASYGSELGEDTDLFDWQPKFRDKMDKVLSCSRNDEFYGDGRKNQIVVFKSCFPNSEYVSEGTPPGNAAGKELTAWNAKATLSSLLPEFRKHPEVLYVYMTAPPLTYNEKGDPAWKWLAKKVLGRPTKAAETAAREGERAREVNTWVRAKNGWLADYPLKNVVVFDYYDILTDAGASNLLRFPSQPGDSHPSHEGNARAAAAFVPFLNRAARRAEL